MRAMATPPASPASAPPRPTTSGSGETDDRDFRVDPDVLRLMRSSFYAPGASFGNSRISAEVYLTRWPGTIDGCWRGCRTLLRTSIALDASGCHSLNKNLSRVIDSFPRIWYMDAHMFPVLWTTISQVSVVSSNP